MRKNGMLNGLKMSTQKYLTYFNDYISMLNIVLSWDRQQCSFLCFDQGSSMFYLSKLGANVDNCKEYLLPFIILTSYQWERNATPIV